MEWVLTTTVVWRLTLAMIVGDDRDVAVVEAPAAIDDDIVIGARCDQAYRLAS